MYNYCHCPKCKDTPEREDGERYEAKPPCPLRVGATFPAVLVALGVGSVVLERKGTVHAASTQAPKFEVDPMWPKPLPNHWVMGNVIGVSVDSQDHIWIIHRQGSLEAMEDYGVANPPGRRSGRTA